MHPILLSSEGIITKLLGKRFHQPVGPDERGYTLNKIGHLCIGFCKQVQWLGLSLLDVLDVGIYVERLKKKKWQMFHQTELV